MFLPVDQKRPWQWKWHITFKWIHKIISQRTAANWYIISLVHKNLSIHWFTKLCSYCSNCNVLTSTLGAFNDVFTESFFLQPQATIEWQPVLLEEHDSKLLQHFQMEPFINSLTQWGMKTHSQDWASSPKGTALDCL